ncbi:succinate dehydrogenase assembly factor 4 [Azospirillum sp.]|uniref:succinate dehydrogenase assembly factor 4 n=1 Tax=Azospirillum sp. TaxID=34012 RepID=UPI003D74E3CD
MSDDTTVSKTPASVETTPPADSLLKGPEQKPGEIGGPKGPEPTRYGDWEFKGRCSDF